MLETNPFSILSETIPVFVMQGFIISMILLIISFIFMVWFAAKIYRVGILMYGKKPSYRDLYKWLKYKG